MRKFREYNGLNTWQAVSLAILAGLVFFIPFNGGMHLFDWDEINFAESAREMIVSGNYLTVQIRYEPFWEKPPLFIWFQVLSMKLFGINEFAARFPNAIAGIFTLLLLYFYGTKVRDRLLGTLWMIAYAGSILPFFYFKSGIIDPWFNLFIFLGVAHFSFYFIFPINRLRNLLLSAIFTGLAVLTKGPVAVLILVLVFLAFLIRRKFTFSTTSVHVILFILVLSLTSGLWFLLQVAEGNYAILRDFVYYQIRLFTTHDAGHKGFLLYHFVVLFLGVFPASVFALPGLFRKSEGSMQHIEFAAWMRALFWIVLILFTIVKTKIVHYSSLCYFPLTFMAATWLYERVSNKKPVTGFLLTLSLLIGSLFAIVLAALIFIGINPSVLLNSNLTVDSFTKANLLADAAWKGTEFLIPALFLTGILILSLLKIKKFLKVPVLFIMTMLFTYFSIIFITPRIEEYSQKAPVEFFRELKAQDVYVATLGYKSYAHLFYAEIGEKEFPKTASTEWLLKGNIDKPAYFSFKINKKEKYLSEYPDLILLYEKNGFVFAKRNPLP